MQKLNNDEFNRDQESTIDSKITLNEEFVHPHLESSCIQDTQGPELVKKKIL